MPKEAKNEKERVTLICSINCPECDEKIVIKKKTKVVKPAIPAERDEKFFAEKDKQTMLPGAPAPKKRPGDEEITADGPDAVAEQEGASGSGSNQSTTL